MLKSLFTNKLSSRCVRKRGGTVALQVRTLLCELMSVLENSCFVFSQLPLQFAHAKVDTGIHIVRTMHSAEAAMLSSLKHYLAHKLIFSLIKNDVSVDDSGKVVENRMQFTECVLLQTVGKC
jgi:hypothetical protein